MARRRSGRLEMVRTPLDLLDAAAGAVGRDIERILEGAGIRRHDSITFLDRVVDELRARLAGTTPRPVPVGLAGPLLPPLLAAIAREVIRLPENAASAAAAIEVLRAMESLRAARSDGNGSLDSTTSEDLRSRLHAPDAFELLVEVAHDFRSPLTSILFLAETIRDGHSGQITEHQRSQLGLIYGAAFGLASVASDIMDLARQERDLIDDEPEPYPVSEVFHSVERLVRPIVEEKGLVLRVVLPERARALGYPHALRRVMLNLTTNALKFTDRGSVEIGVQPQPHGKLEYYVRDTGRGIPVARQAELFRPFKRKIGHAREGHFFSGSGVGLSIARRLVEGMGSELQFSTSNDTGTRFWFEVTADPSGASQTLE